MSRFRFHLDNVLIVVVLLGIGFAALREANNLWDSIALSAAIVVLLVSIVLAIHRKRANRAFWVGFTLFGWSYVGLTAMPTIEPRLLTTRALAYLDSLVPGRPVIFPHPVMPSGPFGGTEYANTWSFIHIGHSLFALILAWLGGHLSRHLYLRNREVLPPEADHL
jgi:hypothetical protein